MKLIQVHTHKHHLDGNARLMTTGPGTGRDIYRVTGGYLAMWGYGEAFPDLFETVEAAQAAQATYQHELNELAADCSIDLTDIPEADAAWFAKATLKMPPHEHQELEADRREQTMTYGPDVGEC